MDPFLSEIVDLAGAAVSYPTTADRPAARRDCLNLFLDYFKEAPLEVTKREYEGNPLAIIKPSGVEHPRVFLCGHLDVVPADDRLFTPRLEGDRLYGRGALDMKGGLAVLSAVVKSSAHDPPPWWLIIVSDEEVGGQAGAGRLAGERLPADLFMVAEPSQLKMITQSKGALRLRISHRGRSAHASTPWQGENSVEKIMACLPRLRRILPEPDEEAWQTTVCPSIIGGGTVINQVPDECHLSLDIRYIPDDDPEEITARLREELAGYDIEVLETYPPMLCRADAPSLLPLEEAYRKIMGEKPAMGRQHGASDARYFTEYMDALVFGPSGEGLHGPEEWVGLSSLSLFARILEEWGRSLRRIR